MIHIAIFDAETGERFWFPAVAYTSKEETYRGINNSSYEKVDLELYQKELKKVCIAMGATIPGTTKTAFFTHEKELSTSRLSFNCWPGLEGDDRFVRVSFSIGDDPEDPTPPDWRGNQYIDVSLTNDLDDYTYTTDESWSDHELRKLDKVDVIGYGSRGYRYEKHEHIANHVMYYDSENGYALIASLFGTQPHKLTVVTQPNFIWGNGITDTVDQRGYKVFPFDTDYNPLDQGGNSDEDGGYGDFDGSSDDLELTPLPIISATDTGFVTLFNPSLSEIRELAHYMWSDLFSVESFKKIFADPMDAILGLSIVPVHVPDGGPKAVTVGNIPTGITMNSAASQYCTVDCGTLNINEYWGSALDYSPNTKVTIWLPYIGYRQLDTDEIMRNPVHVMYRVDILTGSCVAFVSTRTSDGKTMYTAQFEGNCAVQVPITSNDWSNTIRTAVSVIGSAAVTVASGGAGAVQAGAVAAGLTNTVNGVMNGKPSVQKSGGMSGGGGQLAMQTPFLIVERPRQSMASGYNTFEGFPSNITSTIGALTGFTSVESIHLQGINATDSELAEIEALLKGGVIV